MNRAAYPFQTADVGQGDMTDVDPLDRGSRGEHQTTQVVSTRRCGRSDKHVGRPRRDLAGSEEVD
jgi:hypothetical protein